MKRLSLKLFGLLSAVLVLPCSAQFGLKDPYQCQSIVVARYLGYNKKDNISYKTPPVATYRVCVFLKGPPCGANGFRIRYWFDDATKGVPPPHWAFKPSLMPRKNSLWILFIPSIVPINGETETFRGAVGRVAFTKETSQSVLKQIESSGQKSDWYKSLDMGTVLHEVDSSD